jgi:hypothetical protein
VTATSLGEATIRELVTGHDDLARTLFADVPAERLAVFVSTLDHTIVTFTRLMEETS